MKADIGVSKVEKQGAGAGEEPMMSGRLSGKACVITGTGGSVGRAAALAFARERGSVIGCDVNVAAAEATVEMVRAQGGTMISLQPCHLTEPSECHALVDLAVREYGRIDVLFNNAAMAYFQCAAQQRRQDRCLLRREEPSDAGLSASEESKVPRASCHRDARFVIEGSRIIKARGENSLEGENACTTQKCVLLPCQLEIHQRSGCWWTD
jgi:hypothetical protein